MKTTLEIPDRTFRRAKATASALGIPLREYVTRAVEDKLTKSQRAEKPWLECAGELAHLHRETIRIQKRIDEEFGRIEPEDLT
ncbi:MAG: hypothetical protein JNM66_05445 [Bryobacterales bacterium]|nr:hypothetical protein [Bryobacterales bacterium]